MAKRKPSLLSAAKSLPVIRCGQRRFHESLTPSQKREFDEMIAWYRKAMPGERPIIRDMVALIKTQFGRSIAPATFRNYVNEK